MIFGDNVINIIYRLAAPKFIEEVYDDFDISWLQLGNIDNCMI